MGVRMAKARKMVSLNIEEASGVDHPAHLHEGWLVIKSDNLTGMDDLLSDLNKQDNNSDESLYQKGTEEETMAQDDTQIVIDEAKTTPEVEIDKAMHNGEDKKKMSYDDMMKKIADLEEELDKANKKLAKMMEPKEDEMKKEDITSLIKSAPEPIREM